MYIHGIALYKDVSTIIVLLLPYKSYHCFVLLLSLYLYCTYCRSQIIKDIDQKWKRKQFMWNSCAKYFRYV